MGNKYSPSEFVRNCYSLILTKLFYPQCRLVRRPIFMRGKASFSGGKNLTLGRSCRFDLNGEKPTLFIGDDCQFGDYTHIVAHERVEIGQNCLLASKIFISDTSHGTYDNTDETARPDIAPNARKLVTAPVKIGKNVWVGENVVILSGVEIGDGCIIGANSVITKNIPSDSVVVKNNMIIKKYCKEKGIWEKKND